MKKPVPVHIFYSNPYLDEKHPNYCSFQLETELLVENIPFVGDSFHLVGLFSRDEIEKQNRICSSVFKGFIDLVLVKGRLIKYKNSEIECIGLSVTEN